MRIIGVARYGASWDNCSGTSNIFKNMREVAYVGSAERSLD